MAALRSTQLTVEMLYLPNPPELRSTQQTLEYIFLPPPVVLRSTQQTVEFIFLPPSKPILWQLAVPGTQEI